MKTAWEKVQIARQTQRPKTTDYIKNIFNDFIEFHGDRNFGDDKAIIGGIALLDEIPVTVIVQKKTWKEILECQNQKDIEKH